MRVSQRGPAPVRAALSVSSTLPGLQFVIEPSTLTVPPAGAAAARLTVRPTAMLTGTEARTYPFTIVATPVGGSGSPVRIDARFSQRPAPALKVQLVTAEQRAADEAVYMVRITNPSDAVVEVEFSGRSPQNSLTFNFTPALVAVNPGATEETAVQIKPRARLDQPGERVHGFTVRAEPGGIVAPAEATGRFIQTALQGPVLLLQPSSVSTSGAGTFALQLANPRNAPLDVELRALSPDGRALVSVTPARLRLPPGGHGAARVVAKPAGRLLAGEMRRICAFTIEARTADMPRAGVAQGSLVQTPGVAFGPLLRWLALALVGLGILFVAAYILFAVRTSPGPDPAALAATADAIAAAENATATASALAGVATGTASAHAAATATASAQATATAIANATGTALARSNDTTRAAATRAALDAMATQAAGQAAAKATQDAMATASAKAIADAQATANAAVTRAAQDTTPPAAGITRSPANPTRNDKITLTVEANDNGGLARVQIVVNGVVVKECPGSPCGAEVGPFPSAASLTYSAPSARCGGESVRNPGPDGESGQRGDVRPGRERQQGVLGERRRQAALAGRRS